MKYIDYQTLTGVENMMLDSKILEEAISLSSKEPVFRFYGWSPACVSLGKNQEDRFIDYEFLKSIGVDCVRRQTGGRALFHDNELTYSYVTPISLIKNGQNVSESYKYISSILINVFKNLGINLTIGGCPRHITKNNYCMSISTGADLCWSGKKFIGSAQYRKNGYILQHGSILLDYNRELLTKIFTEPTDFDTIVTLHEISPNIKIDDIIKSFKSLYL